VDVLLDVRHRSPNQQCWADLVSDGATTQQIVRGSLSSAMLAQLQ
jgi:hypothetical protein